ncbi:diphthamide biosynthesis enzyme Dph2, partial [Candidatus Bathyarchaeota archaeon]|nr:diphthamide biosynthesis enzyme Dph2 [Candidatus Bathyarchaeota archaeon]
QKTGALPIISADPCYGACDLATAEAESLGVDLIIHHGHSRMLKYERVPTVYVEARATVSVETVVEKALPLLKEFQRVGLATIVQHVHTLDFVREILLRAGKTVVIGDAGRVNYPGQVIGCDYSNAKSIASGIDAFLFIGGGRFHALGVALSTSKPTIVADPYEKTVYSIDEEARKILKQRWASIVEAKKAKIFAVLVGLKPGQKRLEKALTIKQNLEKTGKTAFLFAIKEITPEALMEFPTVDAYVNTACPRIALDDASKFQKPVLTLNEARVIVNDMSWEELCREGLFEN